MGKGHKDRRKEQRARELEQRDTDERELKNELEEENEKKIEVYQSIKKQKEEQIINEKLIETSSDTDSGHGSSITTSISSPKVSKSVQQDEPTVDRKRLSLVKGLHNIGNTCFFNVIIQSLAHTLLLTDTMYETICIIMEENGKKYSSTTTAQLMNIFNEFTSTDRKKTSIDPKPLFNSLIQKVPSYKGYAQHDSHELFMNLMLILRAEEIQLKELEATRSITPENDDDPSKMFCLIGCNEAYTTYDSIFGGHLLDVLTCQKCGKSLMKIEPFIGLLLPLTDRMSVSENYRNRRKRNEYTGNKTKKEPKILSRKQQKALKKQEKKNGRKGAAAATTGKIKGRQAAKKKVPEEQLPLDESSSLPNTEETTSTNEENPINESVDEKIDTPVQDEEQSVVEEEQSVVEEEQSVVEEGQSVVEDNEEEEQPVDEDSDEEDEEDQPKGPLTAVESTCILSDMVSKLTLIHETSSRPLPFVDESLARLFLNCNKTIKDAIPINETDDIKSLEQCFQRYFKSEKLCGENLFDCYYCRSLEPGQKRVLTEATRQTVFFQLPPILPVFLKRFQMHGSHSEKIHKFIEFPLQLDVTDRCSSRVKSKSSIYSLYAVIEHSGTLRSGHYISYIKQSINDNDLLNKTYSQPIDYLLSNLFKTTTNDQSQINSNETETIDPSSPPSSWYHISDNSIHKVPESKVLEADAYVLFYRRI